MQWTDHRQDSARREIANRGQMARRGWLAVVLAALAAPSCTTAGGASSLPHGEEEFDQVVQTWMIPGDALAEGVARLEAKRFRCERVTDSAATRCVRTEKAMIRPLVFRHYTVTLDEENDKIRSVACDVRLEML